MKKIILSFVILTGILGLILLAPSCTQTLVSDAPNRALIVSGQNNHTWQGSTPVLKQILENSGLFSVDVAQTPAAGKDMSTFKPDFSKYQVVVLDYYGDFWPEETKKAFETYVSGGGGVVVYHAADNAFPDWKEYNKMIGLGGWGDRSEKDGPYIRWRDGGFVRDTFPGKAGSHGPQHAFQVTVRNTEHPITKGLPAVWLHSQDELYSELRGPAENLTVLATAFADTASKGTGQHEPMLMTINYGKGRVFHTALGHAMGDAPYPAMECVGFIVTLQRGAEWAATGAVTQAVPEVFPTFNVESKWPLFRPITLVEILSNLKDYKPGDTRSNLQDLTNYLRQDYDGGEKYAKIEKNLLQFLQGTGSSDAKNYICKELSVYGTDQALPILKKLQKNEETAEMARYAIERITGEYTN
ncbi:MAG: ThuA domain-containing protein [Bacteroidales bacterium]